MHGDRELFSPNNHNIVQTFCLCYVVVFLTGKIAGSPSILSVVDSPAHKQNLEVVVMWGVSVGKTPLPIDKYVEYLRLLTLSCHSVYIAIALYNCNPYQISRFLSVLREIKSSRHQSGGKYALERHLHKLSNRSHECNKHLQVFMAC